MTMYFFNALLALSVVAARPLTEPDVDTLANIARSYKGVRIPHANNRRQVPSSDSQYPAFNVLHHLSGIAPYFDSPGVGLQPSPPSGCRVTGAAYLFRHSDIYANDFDYENVITPFLEKYGNFTNKTAFSNAGALSFLSNWTAPFGNITENSEKVTPLGVSDATALGQLFGLRYPGLLNHTSGNASNITVWAASANRSVTTANAFINGLKANSSESSNATTSFVLQVIQEEENQGADTLTPHESCDGYSGARGSEQSKTFDQIYAAAPAARLESLVPGFNFTYADVKAMQQLCGYETVITNTTSNFCSLELFSEEEWLGFEYSNDLMYNYNIGYGYDASPALGLPWIEASFSALALNVSDNASRYAAAPQDIYLSFSHREEPAFLVTALGLYNETGADINDTLPVDRINYFRSWRTSQILPFLGNVGLEKLECTVPALSNGTNSSTTPTGSSYIRVLVNSAPLPLPNCPGNSTGPGGSCTVDAFTEFLQQRIAQYGDFNTECGLNTTEPDNITFYGNISSNSNVTSRSTSVQLA